MKLIDYREQKGISQSDLAYEAGLSTPTISKIERGLPVSRKSLVILCRYIGIDIQELEGVEIMKTTRRGRPQKIKNS